MYNTQVDDIDLDNCIIDEYGAKYSSDYKKLIKAPTCNPFFIRLGTEIICDRACQRCGIEGELVIPETVKVIGACAFANNESLLTINIPKSVVFIANNNPFGGCNNIKCLKIESNKFCIKDAVLYDANFSIAYALIPYLIDSLENNELRIVDSAKEIAANFMWGIDSNLKIVIPESVKKLGKAAFANSSFNNLILEPAIEEIPASFFSFTKCNEVVFRSSIKRIGEWGFGFHKISNIIIPNSIISVDDYGLASENVRTQNNEIFIDSYLGKYSLYNADIENIFVGDNVCKLPDSCFAHSKVKTIVLGKKISSVEDCAFNCCEQLENIVFNSIPKSFGNSVFCGCDKLKKIRIPQNTKDQFASLLQMGCPSCNQCSNLLDDGTINIDRYEELNKIIVSLRNNFKLYSQSLDKHLAFDMLKSDLNDFQRFILNNGWYSRNYIHDNYSAGNASLIYASFTKNGSQKEKFIAISIYELSKAYVDWQDRQLHNSTGVLLMRAILMAMKYMPISIAQIVSNIELNVDDDFPEQEGVETYRVDEHGNKISKLSILSDFLKAPSAKFFMSFLGNMFFEKSIEFDNVNNQYVPRFNNDTGFVVEQLFQQRHNCLLAINDYRDEIMVADPDTLFYLYYRALLKNIGLLVREYSVDKFDEDFSNDFFISAIKYSNGGYLVY